MIRGMLKHKFKILMCFFVISVVIHVSFIVILNTYVPVRAFTPEQHLRQNGEYCEFIEFLSLVANIGYRYGDDKLIIVDVYETYIPMVNVYIRRRHIQRLVTLDYFDSTRRISAEYFQSY